MPGDPGGTHRSCEVGRHYIGWDTDFVGFQRQNDSRLARGLSMESVDARRSYRQRVDSQSTPR